MAETSGPSEYTIAAVSKLTGVSCHALRAWERRYGFPVPHRSPSKHRRYAADQVRVLCRIAYLMRRGHPISGLVSAYREGKLDLGPEVPEPANLVIPSRTTELVNRLLAGDLAGSEQSFDAFVAALSPTELVEQVIEPALSDVGERWYRRECHLCQERLASCFLLRRLQRLVDESRRSNSEPKVTAVVGSVQGDRHEGGALLLALLMEHAGCRALLVGADLPVREYQKAVELWTPDALCLSFVLSRNINKRFQELARIRDVPVFVGGRSILNYQGLARRNGLIPLPGSAAQAVEGFLRECARRNPRQKDDTSRRESR